MKITLPSTALVVLIGASGSGKSTFATKHFLPTQVLSSDFYRGLVSDDENSQSASTDAFEVLHYILRKRLKNNLLSVIDATNVQAYARKPLVAIAKDYHVMPVAIVLDVPEHVAVERNVSRPDRAFGSHIIKAHRNDLKRSLKNLKKEGFRRVYHLKDLEEIENLEIEYEKLWNDRTDDHGPFDIIGDVHGCFDELVELLEILGYQVDGHQVTPIDGRKVVFVGDLVDRGPRIPDVLKLVMSMVADNTAICVPGNHDIKLVRALQGRNVQVTHGLADSLAQLANEPEEFRIQVMQFLDGLVSHYVFDDGKLVVAHAGMKEEMAGRASSKVRDFALYGETTGETDEFGLPVRYKWAEDYRGKAMVVYGHTPVPEPEWLNNTINVDTGCVFGGALTALRYPERATVSVDAHYTYAEPARPFIESEVQAPSLSAQQKYDNMLDLADVTGKRIINTQLRPQIVIREENAIAALEIMSRFAVNPKWLIYLPPTMSPSETSHKDNYLEYPTEAFAYFRSQGIPQVVVEEKHMGSRAVVIVCRDENAARKRFGVINEGIGIVYTRTGRRFFEDARVEEQFLKRLRDAINQSNFWENFETDWVVLDCELMPWSEKAQWLLQNQYAAVGTSGLAALGTSLEVLQLAQSNGVEVDHLLPVYQQRHEQLEHYVNAYRRYCWPIHSLDDYTLAPFHILATEGQTHTHQSHVWHMQEIARICESDKKFLLSTAYHTVDVTNDEAIAQATEWWEELTSKGGEGMVVKPTAFIPLGKRQSIQPAIKVRGPEYLRIIYGADYQLNLASLRRRGLGKKRLMALREFALGIESLERFVRKEPLRRVHECVFGVLAMESEPVDPRL